jgi:hypothetical protein
MQLNHHARSFPDQPTSCYQVPRRRTSSESTVLQPARFKNNRGDGVATYSKRWTIATSSPSISGISTATVVGSARTGNPG